MGFDGCRMAQPTDKHHQNVFCAYIVINRAFSRQTHLSVLGKSQPVVVQPTHTKHQIEAIADSQLLAVCNICFIAHHFDVGFIVAG